jgi:hypothetical protein
MTAFTVLDVIQGSEEWLQARVGLATASRAADVTATIKTGEAAARRDYRLELACERLTGRPTEQGFVSKDMQRGTECEPLARLAFEALTGDLVQTVGFVRSTTQLAGCSPDGYLGDFAALLQIKCPKSATHLRYLQQARFPVEHEAQMLHELLMVPSAQVYEFVSWDDRMPARLQVFRSTVRRASVETAIADYQTKLMAFLDEVAAQVVALERMSA